VPAPARGYSRTRDDSDHQAPPFSVIVRTAARMTTTATSRCRAQPVQQGGQHLCGGRLARHRTRVIHESGQCERDLSARPGRMSAAAILALIAGTAMAFIIIPAWTLPHIVLALIVIALLLLPASRRFRAVN
jgi:uncharacterized protein (DUF983 family)